MRVRIEVEGAGARRWHRDLGARLGAALPGARFEIVPTAGPGLPSALDLLLTLEGIARRLPGPRPSDRIELPKAGTGEADLVLALGAGSGLGAGRRLSVRYDGVADEGAIFAALLAGRAPWTEIADGAGAILAAGRASIENAGSVREGYEAVVARTATLLGKALRRPAAGEGMRPLATGRPGGRSVARYAAKFLAREAARRLYKLCCYAPHWRVGWRFVTDRDVWDRGDLGGEAWTVLPDPGFRFYADPFPVTWRGETWLFVEDLDHRHGKGIISAIPFGAHGPSGPMRPVLELPWHLSYPFMIEDGGALWMVPESSGDRSVRLYRCDRFPDRWTEEARLLEGVDASDATIVRHDGRYWMFATVREDDASYSDSLSIFSADRLAGPWTAHPGNPVVVDAGAARPAGHVVQRGGRLLRPVQDCRAGYGTALGLAEITRLDGDGYEQVVRTVLRPDRHWPGRRLHTLNRAGRLEVIDGSGHAPKPLAWAALRGG